jgi:hypothetical protein
LPGTPTPNLGLIPPTVGSDNNVWGNYLNQDLATIDTLAVSPIININSSYAAVVTNAVEQVILCTTGALAITVTLPAPSVSQGKIFTVKKIDSGVGTVTINSIGGGTIDGQGSWVNANQYVYVRVISDGVSYDVIGNN